LPPVDFNKSCEDRPEPLLPPAGWSVEYHLCGRCGFCFAPALHAWRHEDFARHVYNDAYVTVDPDYLGARPEANASALDALLGQHAARIRHLDFGGGDGLLSRRLQERGWQSSSCDPFLEPNLDLARLGRFSLVTAYEVFEHVPDVDRLIRTLGRITERQGVVLFSTLLADGQVRAGAAPTWWYAAPRNGHISLFSRRSLELLGLRAGFSYQALDNLTHLYWRQAPRWACEVFRLPRNRR
jgi:SAM-dependent methyltransferase